MANVSGRNASANWCLPGTVMKSALIKNKFSVCSVNSQSICARKLTKLDELRQISQLSNVDVICVTESWLNDRIDNPLLTIEGYNIVRHDRKGRLGGGILIFIKEGMRYTLLEKSVDQTGVPNAEYLAIEILLGNEKLFFVGMYNPPEVNCTDVIDCLLSKYGTHYSNLFVTGDLNTNLLNHNSIKTTQLTSLLSIHNMFSLGSEPTFYHKYGSSQLDLMLFNSRSRVLRFNQIDVPNFSNHDMIFASLDFDMIHIPQKVEYRDYNSVDIDGLLNAYNSLDWRSFFRSNDPNFLLSFFNSNILELHNRFVPLRTFVSRKNQNTWFSDAVSKALVERDLAYKRWKQTKSTSDLKLFKTLRNQVNLKVRQAKKAHYENTLDTNLPSKELWKRLKSIGVGKSSKSPSNQFKADEINSNFARNFSMSSSSCDSGSVSNQTPAENSFYFSQINEIDVISALYHMKSNAIGLDELPIKFLKSINPLIIKPVTHLINCIIATSIFPDEWKKSKILPFKKKTNLNTLQNLRPISILSALSKIFERLIKNQICQYINQENLLIAQQSGYRAKHSTKTAMLKVFDDIGLILDKGRPVVLLLLDFSKAFDTISHKILCHKLCARFGFSNHAKNLIESYLSGRTQTVLNNGFYSSYLPISSGVPQGSILGPILFSLYINDLPEVLKYCSIHVFADDVQLYFGCTDDSAAVISRKINEDMSNIHAWSVRNKLLLNADKTCALFLSHSHSNSFLKPILKLNNTEIPFLDEGVSLGITIQSNFKFDKFIFKQCGKIYASLRTLYALSTFLSTDIKLKLFKSLIFPHFVACDFLLSESSMYAQSRLQVALNSCIRFVFNLDKYASVSHLQHRLIGCPFNRFTQLRSCLFLFKLARTSAPGYLHTKLKPLRSLRAKKYAIPRHNSSLYGNSFFVRGISHWNSLPNDITLENSSLAFRRKCIEHFNN